MEIDIISSIDLDSYITTIGPAGKRHSTLCHWQEYHYGSAVPAIASTVSEKREPLTEIKWIKDGENIVFLFNDKEYDLDADLLVKEALPIGVSVYRGGKEVGETTKVSRAFRDNKSMLCIKPVQGWLNFRDSFGLTGEYPS